MPRRSNAEILGEARELLVTAQMGLENLRGADPTRRRPGLRAVATFGRAVIHVLLNLRANDRSRFNAWYEPREEAMEQDPLTRYFIDLRNRTLKEGMPTHSVSLTIDYLDTADLASIQANPPPNARGFFIGDNLGGSGWEVEMPDGTIEKFYVQLPGAVKAETTLHLPDPPGEHLGVPIVDSSLENLSALYLDYLDALLRDAEFEFS